MVITCTSLKSIQLRREEKLLCNHELSVKKLKIKAYGETDIVLASFNSADLKVALFGDNTFVIRDNHTTNIKFNTYGENRLNTQNLYSNKG